MSTAVPDLQQTILHQYTNVSSEESHWTERAIGSTATAGDKVSIGAVPWQLALIDEIVPVSATAPAIKDYYYDPFGQSIDLTTGAYSNTAQPANAPGATSDGWLGKDQKMTEDMGGLDLIQMGARVYSPALGRFLQTDPIPGGSANNYDYVNQDPVNKFDLAGTLPCTSGVFAYCGGSLTVERVVVYQLRIDGKNYSYGVAVANGAAGRHLIARMRTSGVGPPAG